MKTAIVYYSKHHGNTKKLLDAIADIGNVKLIDATDTYKHDLNKYELIGFASGIYYSKFHNSVLKFAENNLPREKKVFFIYTCGVQSKGYTNAIKAVVKSKNAQILGQYGCKGYNTYGPFKLIGGIAKGHPNDEDIANAAVFYKSLT